MTKALRSLCAALSMGAVIGIAPPAASGQANRPELVADIPVNYDDALVGTYTLPDPLVLENGQPVRDAETWYNRRRPELVRLFEENQYGRAPARPADMHFEIFEQSGAAFDGKAIRRQVTIHFSADPQGPKVDLLVYLPAGTSGPVPLLMALGGSPASAVADSMVRVGEVWSAQTRTKAPVRRGTTTPARIESLLAAGFGYAIISNNEIDPDFLGGAPLGVRGLFLAEGQTEPAPDEWGAISAWAWGLSRALDYFETDPDVDARRVAITGASRLGKTVLWAGVRDPRFAMVIASVSGEGGAALSRRNYGETVAHLVAPTRYPYQFAGNYANYAADPNLLPFDSHMLVALMAPRPLLLLTGETDYWSDPMGEFHAAVAAEPVYRLLGARGLETDVVPPLDQPILNTLGFLMHDGGHSVLPHDWEVFQRFMEMHLLND